MSPLYFGGTDCPTCGATIPKGEPCQICALRAQLAERDREIERVRAQALADRGFQSENARLRDQVSASQAREREAVERAEKAEAQAAEESGNCTYSQREWKNAESALAAARKALAFYGRHEPTCPGWTEPDGRRAMNACTCGFSAALNGDSHAE